VARNESIRTAVRSALQRVGPDVVVDAARLCGDAFPPPGKVGDYPHRRTGTLSGSFSYRIEDGPNGPVFVLENNAPYAAYVNASRPYLKLVMDKWGPALTAATAQAVARAGGTGTSAGRGGVRGFAGRAASAVSSGFRRLFGF
jgi:hypothetical protein